MLLLQLVLKLIAFGPNYFNSFRNVYDFLLCVLSVAFIAMASYYMTPGNRQNLVSPNYYMYFVPFVKYSTPIEKLLPVYYIQDLQYVTDMALSISVLRLFTILMKYVSSVSTLHTAHH